jgi:hypothetical protein
MELKYFAKKLSKKTIGKLHLNECNEINDILTLKENIYNGILS